MTARDLPADTTAMWKFAARLAAGMPLFEADIAAVRASIGSCRQQAMRLRVSQAESILRTVQISAEMDKIRRAA